VTTSKPPETVQKTPRSDAERNRVRILEAARAVFGERGLWVPMSEVARRADVGIATLMRHFANREALIAATFATTMTLYADTATEALADPDPWHGFCWLVESVCAMQAADRGFSAALTMTFPAAPNFEAERSRAYRSFVKLVAKAKAAGGLRADFSPQDLPLMLMANAGVIAATVDVAPNAWRRLVGYLLQACSAEHAQELPAEVPGRQMYQAMQAIGPSSR
jgi:AcrR family transcriptional regulator